MSRHIMHAFAVTSLLTMAVTFTTGATLAANAPNSTHSSEKSTAASSNPQGAPSAAHNMKKPVGIRPIKFKPITEMSNNPPSSQNNVPIPEGSQSYTKDPTGGNNGW